jgi:hypothetical protein
VGFIGLQFRPLIGVGGELDISAGVAYVQMWPTVRCSAPGVYPCWLAATQLPAVEDGGPTGPRLAPTSRGRARCSLPPHSSRLPSG